MSHGSSKRLVKPTKKAGTMLKSKVGVGAAQAENQRAKAERSGPRRRRESDEFRIA